MADDEAAGVSGALNAPGWRRLAAGLVDAGIAAAVILARARARASSSDPTRPRRNAPGRQVLAALVGSTSLRERIGTPGERLLGIRTVDRRTGRPVAFWRVLALTSAGVGLALLRERLSPTPISDEQREKHAQLGREVAELKRRHGDDGDALDAAMAKLWSERGGSTVNVDMGRIAAVGLAATLISRRLQRRLAPTGVVMRRVPPR